ncbi:MAG: MFS transporter [Rhodospirillales bacterium]
MAKSRLLMTASYRTVPLVVACALFMEMVDATVLSTALPAIAADLAVTPVSLSMAITAYVLSLALFIPLSGWLADRIGAKQVFSLAIVVFLLGSISCGLSESLWQLVAARFLQGLGGALMTPVARLILLRAVPRERLVDAMAWMGVPALIGPLMGPPLGGFLVDVASWRWIFWINVPIGLIGLVAVWRLIPAIPRRARRPFDRWGFLLLGCGLISLIGGLELAGGEAASLSVSLPLVAAGILLLLVYGRHALRRAAPVIDLRLLRYMTFRASLLGGLLFRLAGGALPLLLPLSLQSLHGYSASQSGLIVASAAFGAIAMKIMAGRVIGAFGFRRVLLFNALTSALLVGLLGLPDPSGLGLWLLIGLLILGGFTRSLQFTSLNTIAFAEVAEDRMGDATAFSSVFAQLSMALGVTLAALLLTYLPTQGAAPDATDFALAFAMIGLGMSLSFLFFVGLGATAGDHLSRRGARLAAGGETTVKQAGQQP